VLFFRAWGYPVFPTILLYAALLFGSTVAADAQTLTAEERAAIVSPLPPPSVDDNARPSEFLRAAQTSLIGGRTGETRQALEMAQTRMLDRSVPLFQTQNPSEDRAVRLIAQALEALTTGDREACIRLIQDAILIATAQGN